MPWPKGLPRDPRSVEAAAAKMRGRSHTPEWNARIGASLRGVRKTQEHRDAMSLAQRTREDYHTAHKRMTRHGSATKCDVADSTCSETFQFALRHDAPVEHLLFDGTQKFSHHRSDYWELCASHHYRYDRKGETFGA